jgi:hypothetical protein
MSDFNFAPQIPQPTANTNNNSQRQSNIDWDGYWEYIAEQLGGEGTHSLIGVPTNIYELGMQEQQEQVLPWDATTQNNQGWRLEKYEDGNPKDKSAHLEQRMYKRQMQECLVYTPQPVAQAAVAVDFMEVMIDRSKFFGDSEKPSPFREIIGKNGFVPAGMRGKGNYIVKPFNLRHINVNRQKDGAAPHYAIAKNGMLYNMAEWAGVLDGNNNFHIEEIGKLIGKPLNFDVEVKWERWTKDGSERKKLVINVKPASKLSPRDKKYFDDEIAPKIDESSFGMLLFKGKNDENTIKMMRKEVYTTMSFALNWDESDLKSQIKDVHSEWFDTSGYTAPQKAPEPKKEEPTQSVSSPVKQPESAPVEPETVGDSFDFDDDQL